MDHVPYQKVYESTRAWGTTKLPRGRWVATEKVHGANFCILVGPEGLRYAKRGALLGDDEDFFGFRRVIPEQYGAKAMQVLEAAARMRRGTERVAIYGELFGGHYGHPDVAAVPGVQQVQSGIDYCPDLAFIAFDVALGGGESFLEFSEAKAVCEGAGLMFVEPLMTGTFQEAQNFSIDFDSTLPARLGLPPLPAGSNAAEGVVVRPLKSFSLGNARRPLLKRKITAFSETRYDLVRSDLRRGSGLAVRGAGTRAAFETEQQRQVLRYELLARVNPARVQSAVSKTQALPTEDHCKLLLLVRDVRFDVLQDTDRCGIASVDEIQADAQLMEELTQAVTEEIGRELRHVGQLTMVPRPTQSRDVAMPKRRVKKLHDQALGSVAVAEAKS